MKKKILISILIILLSLAVVMTAVACNNDPKPDPKPDPDPPIVEPEEPVVKRISLGDFIGGLVDGIDNVAGDLSEVEDAVYIDATIFVKFNETEGEVRIAGTFDENNVDNNKALISANLNGRDVVQLYTEKGVIYVGQTITVGAEANVSWTKMSVDTESKILANELANLPAEVADMGLDDLNLRKMLEKDVLPVLGIIDGVLFDTTADLDFDLAQGKGGTMTAVLKIDEIGGLLSSPMIGGSIRPILEEYQEEYGDILDMVFGILFNGTLDEIIEGTIENYPEIKIEAGLSDSGRLTGLSFGYTNNHFGDNKDETVEVEFGIKNLAVSKDSGKSIAPTDVTKVDETALKVRVDLELPEKGIEKAYVEAFLFPEIKVSRDENGDLVVDLSKVSAYASAYILEDGEYRHMDDFTLDFNVNEYSENKVRVNLAGLIDLVEADIDGAVGFFYDLDLNSLINGEDEDDNGVQNAEGNPVDELVELVESDGFDPIDFLTGDLSLLTQIFDAIADCVDAAVTESGRLAVFTLINEIATNEVFANSDKIAEYVDLAYFADFDNILDEIEKLTGMTTAEILEKVDEITGFETDEDGLLALEIDAFGGVEEGKGIGAGVAVYSGDTLVAKVAVYFDIVGDADRSPDWLDNEFDFAGDLDTTPGRDAIVDMFELIYDAYIA